MLESMSDSILSTLKEEVAKEITKEKASRFTRIVKNEASAKNYAKAMFDAGSELNKIDSFKNDFNIIYSSLLFDKELFDFFCSHFVDGYVKFEILKKAYESKISNETFNLLSILIERDLFQLLLAIIVEYENLCNEYYNIVSAKIIVSSEFEDISRLKEYINNIIEKKVHFTIEVDENLIGGFIVEIDDIVYDYSVRKLLNNVKGSLLLENS